MHKIDGCKLLVRGHPAGFCAQGALEPGSLVWHLNTTSHWLFGPFLLYATEGTFQKTYFVEHSSIQVHKTILKKSSTFSSPGCRHISMGVDICFLNPTPIVHCRTSKPYIIWGQNTCITINTSTELVPHTSIGQFLQVLPCSIFNW
uniref:Uncharacterized protein n=1 Tax=Micrurus lemniscatus lemniscatus TaxID=129467 RepID=A0A2D4HZH2_MICLE